jgi:mannose-6-phosphate isomerase-like protein (cupin superfamily)
VSGKQSLRSDASAAARSGVAPRNLVGLRCRPDVAGEGQAVGIRRVVTGHGPDGKAIVASDEEVAPIMLDLLPGYEFFRLWGGDEPPRFPGDGAMPAHTTYFPPLHGFRFGLFTVPPASTVLEENLDIEAALAALDHALPGMAAHLEPDHPGMHTTATIDYEYVVSGSAVLELDDGTAVELHAGDTVVQNGTRHAWRNNGTEPCRMVVVLIGAHHDAVG